MADALQTQAFVDGAAFDLGEAWRKRTLNKKAAALVEHLRGCRSALEVGCGTGNVTELVAAALPKLRLTATDCTGLLETAHEKLARFGNVDVRYYDADPTGQQEPTVLAADYDAVFGVDVLHHLMAPAWSLLTWRRRGVKRIVFLESNPRHPVLALRAWRLPHERGFFLNSRHALRYWAETAGWTNVSCDTLAFHLPNGPSWFDAIENAAHRTPLRRLSSLFLLRAEM